MRGWLEGIAEPWHRVGMGAASLGRFGVLTGEELPLSHPPLLDPAASPARADQPAMRLAAGLRRALEEA